MAAYLIVESEVSSGPHRTAKSSGYLEDTGRFYDHRSSDRNSGRSRQTMLQVPSSARSRHAAVPGTNPRRFASS
jgi:hypothetical protein